MKTRHCLAAIIVTSVILSSISLSSVFAAPVNFVLDPAQSSLQIQAVVTFGTSKVATQGQGIVFPTHIGTSDGSISFYSGTIKTDIAGGSIQFTGGSTIDASITDNGLGWAPIQGGGPAGQTQLNPSFGPADYGLVLAIVYASLQNVVFDITSGATPLVGGTFASNETIPFASGILSYVDTLGIFLPTPGSTDLTGLALNNAAAAGTLAGGVLTVPVNITQSITLGTTPIDLVMTGQLVANQVVPEPGTAALAAMAALCVGWAIARRRSA